MSASKTVKQFNLSHPAGTPVLYRSHPHAEPLATRTTSEAWLMGGHTAVVLIGGVVGCVGIFALTDPS